jgi:putative FmdB family regulatory protein
MPAYDYKCSCCDEVFEVVRSSSDRGDVPCPACGAGTKRVFSPVGVVFKGSGFHATDYRTTGEPEAPKDGGAGSSKDCGGKEDSTACASCPAKKDD